MKQKVFLWVAAFSLFFVGCNDDDFDRLPPGSSSVEIENFIREKYPQSRVLEVETDAGRIEVDIVHDNIGKEVCFDFANQWLYTTWDVRISSLPQVVANIINTPSYTGFRIDDADFVETYQLGFYLLELERGREEIKVKVDIKGDILD